MPDKHGVKRIVTVLLATAGTGAILFASAGSLHWVRGWIFFAAHLVSVVTASVTMALTNPELLNERGKRHRNTEPFEKVFEALYLLLLIILPLVAGLDAVRFAWSALPAWVACPGGLLFACGAALIIWSMAVNPFLETTVRIQPERGHHVVSCGPYRFVRHPMYAGLILENLAAPLMLGSRWMFVPALLVCALFTGRAYLEDRVLRRKLAGYAEYSQVTRYLMVPGVW